MALMESLRINSEQAFVDENKVGGNSPNSCVILLFLEAQRRKRRKQRNLSCSSASTSSQERAAVRSEL